MIELKLNFGDDIFTESNYVYVWFKTSPITEPFYVGETSKSIADRTGLHIRQSGALSRSGATVGKHIHNMGWADQEYFIRGYEITNNILIAVAKENGAAKNQASLNRARKAIEFFLYQTLNSNFENMYKIRASRWTALKANNLISEILSNVKNA